MERNVPTSDLPKVLRHTKTSIRVGNKRFKNRTPRQRGYMLKSDFIKNYSSKLQLLLFLTGMNHETSLSIPETLIIIKDIGKSMIFYNDKGRLIIKLPDNPIESFLKVSNTTVEPKYLNPKYIHHTEDKTQVIFDGNLCESLITSSDKKIDIVQKFIPSCYQTARKYRAFWKRDTQVSVSLITSKNRLQRNSEYRDVDQITSKLYLHRISSYSFAGRLFRSSFSPYFPYKPSLPVKRLSLMTAQSRSITPKEPQGIKKKFSGLTLDSDPGVFLAKGSSSSSLIVSLPGQYTEIEKMVDKLVSIIDSWQKSFMESSINLGTIDFLKDDSGKWYIIGCKIEGVDWDVLIQSLSLGQKKKTQWKSGGTVEDIPKDVFLSCLFEERFLQLDDKIKRMNSRHRLTAEFPLVSNVYERYLKKRNRIII